LIDRGLELPRIAVLLSLLARADEVIERWCDFFEDLLAGVNSMILLLSAVASSCCALAGAPAKEIANGVTARMKLMHGRVS
jgi:hypothetical protein